MRLLIIISISVLLPLSLLGQAIISPSAGEDKTNSGIVVVWAVGQLLEGETLQNKQGVISDPILPIAKLNHSEEHLTMVPSNIRISPNPAKDRISIEFKELKKPVIAIRILTYTGQEVYKQKVSGADGTILFDVSNFTAGNYILQTIDETNKTVSEKLVIF